VPIAFRSATNTGNDQQVSALSVPVPAGAAAKDLVVCVLSRWETFPHTTVTPPAGFQSFVTEVSSGDSNGKLRFYYKALTGADTGTYDFSWTSAMWAHIHALCFSGAKITGDPTGIAHQELGGTWGSMGALTVNVAYAPALVWTTFNTTAATTVIPTSGAYTAVAACDRGTTAYLVPGVSGSYAATGGSVSPSSAAAMVLLAVEPVPPIPLAGFTADASGARGDVSFAGLGVRLTGACGDASGVEGDLSVTGPHVMFAGVAAGGELALADLRLSPVVALDGALLAAQAVAAVAAVDLPVARDLAAVSAAAEAAVADLDVARPVGGPVPLDGVSAAAADAAGALGVTVPVAGAATAAADAAGALGVTVAVAGVGTAAAGAVGVLGAVLRLAGAAPLSVVAVAELVVVPPVSLDGPAVVASGALGDLGVARVLAGRAEVAVLSTAKLDSALAGVAGVGCWAGAELVGGRVAGGGRADVAVWAGAELHVLVLRADYSAALAPRRWGGGLGQQTRHAVLEAQ
jgi:hypothetical protein